jgi:hypothetical protein
LETSLIDKRLRMRNIKIFFRKSQEWNVVGAVVYVKR